jgi:topoisomerase IA-like protein
MAKYSKKSRKTVESAMHRKKKGTLRSGRSGKKVKSRKQAIAIGLSEARKKGAKVPAPKKKSAKKKSAKKTSRKKSAKKSSRKKSSRKKSASR